MDVKNSVHTHENQSIMLKVERHFLHLGRSMMISFSFLLATNERKSARNGGYETVLHTLWGNLYHNRLCTLILSHFYHRIGPPLPHC